MKKTGGLLLLAMFFCVLLLQGGCGSLWQSSKEKKKKRLFITRGKLIGDYAAPGQSGLSPIKIEGFALAENLSGRGCIEPDTPMRKRVVEQFKKDDIAKYQQRIDSTDTAIVYVRSYLRPGIQKGDPIDVEVQLPPASNAETLKGGIIRVASPLTQHLNGRDSFTMAEVKGPILLDPVTYTRNDPEKEKTGYILGQAVCLKDRTFTLIVNDEDRTVLVTKEIQDKINARFKIPNESEGVAEAKTDTRIDLKLHPAYRDSIYRYLQVVLSIACFENHTEKQERMKLLDEELLRPETSQYAALQLEAIGKPGVESLRKGLESQNSDIRFYCAESLAFLGTPDAAPVLMEIAETDANHRIAALNALGTMQNDHAAEQCLQRLLLSSEPVTRYGAFRALWHRNPNNPAIRGEQLGDENFSFSYHVLNIPGVPMVHVSKSKRSEIVLFSSGITLQPPYILAAGQELMIQSEGEKTVVTRLKPGGIPETRTVRNSLNEIIRAVTELGGTYPNVIQFLCEAEQKRNLTCLLKIDVFSGDDGKNLLENAVADDDLDLEPVEPEKKSAWQRLNPASWFGKSE
ncbi:MAG: HEAT repeat domain-containing protein [Planctomycetaceae bacterium]|jgi:hypothetical protein|nr:HEAT repeat domain-containing protein [Planctomycetaceae bacterium]